MLLQYKICTSAFSLMSKLVHCKGGGRKAEGEKQGYGNKVELCFVCCPLHIPKQS